MFLQYKVGLKWFNQLQKSQLPIYPGPSFSFVPAIVVSILFCKSDSLSNTIAIVCMLFQTKMHLGN